MRIGIDFDNTIASYERVFTTAAWERGWVPVGDVPIAKETLRDTIRALPDGEIKWQELQAEVYGHRMEQAKLFPGVAAFLKTCQKQFVQVFIVSHKTLYAPRDPQRVNLRQAAKWWLQAQGSFGFGGPELPADHVYFESTREEKLARIQTLECTHFIDDLEELLLDPAFPRGVDRLLFRPEGPPLAADSPLRLARSWDELRLDLLGT
ncbi:MAG: hypothetical protein HQL82_01110 [Magnetococcales bacterium]|nr:hypothetical protein [Magnetococcales bacterium]